MSKPLLKLLQEISGFAFSGTASISQLSLRGRSTKPNSSGASTRSSVKPSGPQLHSLRDSSQSSLMGFSAANHPMLQPITQLDPPPAGFSIHKPLWDHTRLKEAWDLVLRKRSLAPQIISVLPMYLPMAFAHVRVLPLLRIPLPPDTFTRGRPEFTVPGEVHDSEQNAFLVDGQQSPTFG